MADEEVKNILKDLQLECLVEDFQRNMITIEILEHLTENAISELIPIIGQRVRFLSYWKNKYKMSDLKAISESVENSALNRKRKVQEEEDELIVSTLSSSGKHTEGLNNLYTVDTRNQYPISLKQLLLQYKIGQRILTYYEKENELQDNLRNKLCDIIITDVEDRDITFTNNLADYLSKMIISIFPTEVSTTYYVPPISKKDSAKRKSVISCGKLINMWRNRNTLKRKLEGRIKKEKIEKEKHVPEEICNEVQESIKWLEENLAPWQLVIQHWSITFDVRRKELDDYKENTLCNFLNKWPILKHPEGYQLIVQDFDKMNLSKVKLDLNIWQQFIDVIIKYSTYNSKDDEINLLLEKLRNQDVSADAKVAAGFMLLSHLVPPKKLRKYGGRCYKPSIANAKSSLIKQASIHGDMTIIREEARKTAQMLQLTLQPYVVVLGPPYEVNEAYVQVDDILYKVGNILEAIDVCFKTFHVFQISYPLMSEHIWLLIQKGIYNFNTKWDSIIPATEHILSKVLQSFQKANLP